MKPKRALIALFLILGYTHSNCQGKNTPLQQKIDSLQNLITQTTDSVEIFSLRYEKLKAYYFNSPGDSIVKMEGYKLAEDCLILLEGEQNYSTENTARTVNMLRANTLLIVEQYNEWHYNNTEALENFKIIIPIYAMYKDSSKLSNAHYYKGRILMSIPQFDSAMQSFDTALDYVVNEREKGFIYLDMAYVSSTTGDFDSFVEYNRLCMESFEKAGSKSGKINALVDLASYYLVSGKYGSVLSTIEQSLKIGYEINDSYNLGRSYDVLIGVHRMQNEYDKALEYADSASHNFKVAGYTSGVLVDELSRANIYLDMERIDSVHVITNKVLKVAQDIEDNGTLADAHFLIGKAYHSQENLDKALENYLLAEEMFDVLELKPDRAEALQVLGDIYTEKELLDEAKTHSLAAYQLSKDLELYDIMKISSKSLYHLYRTKKQNNLALNMLEQHLQARDSLNAKSGQKEFIKQQYKLNYEKQIFADSLHAVEAKKLQEAELAAAELTSNFLFVGMGLTLLFGGFMYNRFRITRKQKYIIEKQKKEVELEKEKSDNLLLNILPKETAEELKRNGSVAAKSIELASILFTDFKGFTALAQKMDPESLVKEINYCFSAFDNIIELNKIEKIKTIGDTYMAAGGLADNNKMHIFNLIRSALEMQLFMKHRKQELLEAGKPFFEMRVGIHSGPVIAGVVGLKKFQYDLWGDTVNVASRMESNCEVGEVNISKSTYELLDKKNSLKFKSRGLVKVKGRGEMEMFFVEDS